jgi:GMP synthase-like glutamine amidotransferase
VPDGAVLLADSSIQPQAFRMGERAWAVQFHPEARREQALDWFRQDGHDLPRPLDELERELDQKMGGWHELGTRLCRAFLRAATA